MRKIVLLLLISFHLGAQQELGIYFFDGLHQSAELNPSFDSDHKIVVALPSAFVSFHQRGISVTSFLKGELVDITRRRRNQIMFGSNISALKVSYKHKNFRYNLAHNYRSFADVQFRNPLVSLIANGNAGTIGGKVSFSPNMEYVSFSETVFGAAMVGDFSIGVNFKILNGIQSISTERSAFELSVNDDIYQLELKADYLVNSSFPINFNELQEFSFSRFDFIPNNFGVAFDFGASYKNGPFRLAASVLDVGYLRWNEKPHNYEAQGSFVYEGATYNDIINGDFNFLDTIGGSIDFKDGGQSYTHSVPTRFYFNANYDFNANIALGALVYGHRNYERTNAAIAFNLQRNWNQKHAVAVQYAVVGNNPLNFGLSGYTTLGPVQVYAAFDNLLGMINTLGAENSNFRAGINLVFDREPQEIRAQYADLY